MSKRYHIPLYDGILLVNSLILLLIAGVLLGYSLASQEPIVMILSAFTIILAISMLGTAIMLVIKALSSQNNLLKSNTSIPILSPTITDTSLNMSNTSSSTPVTDESAVAVRVVTLSPIEWRIVNYLREVTEVTQKELVQHCELSKSTVSTNLVSLESKEIIARRRDGKENIISLLNDPSDI